MFPLLPPTLLMIFIALMVLLTASGESQFYIPSPYVFLGLVPIFLGFYLAAISSQLFERMQANVQTFGRPSALVTHGIFQYSRNPMYLGFVIALIGFAILFGASLEHGLLVALFWLITDRWYIQVEEKAMLEAFGEPYLNYKRSVRRWI